VIGILETTLSTSSHLIATRLQIKKPVLQAGLFALANSARMHPLKTKYGDESAGNTLACFKYIIYADNQSSNFRAKTMPI